MKEENAEMRGKMSLPGTKTRYCLGLALLLVLLCLSLPALAGENGDGTAVETPAYPTQAGVMTYSSPQNGGEPLTATTTSSQER